MKRNLGLFQISIIAFFYVLPLITICADIFIFKQTNIPKIILKWCIFYGIGLRLFTAGLKQALSPKFTAKTIFEVTDEKAFPIVRELGFANICSGLIGILSLFVVSFRLPIAIIGIIYFSLALLQHLIRRNKNHTEVFVTITNSSIVLELIIPLLIIYM